MPANSRYATASKPKRVPSPLCEHCLRLEADAQAPHPALKWRMDDFDPVKTQALGAKLFEQCTVCQTRWTGERRDHS